MTHAALSPLIGPEFDQFLGASIGEDRNGTGLSVLSALARLDVDPWKEATSLARLPREAAAVRLTELSPMAATGLREMRVLMALGGFAIMMLVLFTMSALFSGGLGTGAKSSAAPGHDATTVVPSR
jgi:hypothetical protein